MRASNSFLMATFLTVAQGYIPLLSVTAGASNFANAQQIYAPPSMIHYDSAQQGNWVWPRPGEAGFNSVRLPADMGSWTMPGEAQAIEKAKRTILSDIKQGKLNDAEVLDRKYLSLYPRSKFLHNELDTILIARARQAFNHHNYAIAGDKIREVLADEPNNQVAKALYNQIAQKQGFNLNRAEDHVKLADQDFARGKYQQAWTEYKTSLGADPTSAAYVGLGNIDLKKGAFNEAIGQYQQALQIDPNNYVALRQRGITKYAIHDIVGANNDLNSTLKINPQDQLAAETLIDLWHHQVALYPNEVNSHLGLARTYLSMNCIDCAQDQYREVVRIDPNNPQLPAARESVQKALAKHEAIVRYAAAKALEQQGNYPEAYAKMGEALTFYTNPEMVLYRGELAERLGYYPEARTAYLEALNENPHFGPAAARLAAFDRGDHSFAINPPGAQPQPLAQQPVMLPLEQKSVEHIAHTKKNIGNSNPPIKSLPPVAHAINHHVHQPIQNVHQPIQVSKNKTNIANIKQINKYPAVHNHGPVISSSVHGQPVASSTNNSHNLGTGQHVHNTIHSTGHPTGKSLTANKPTPLAGQQTALMASGATSTSNASSSGTPTPNASTFSTSTPTPVTVAASPAPIGLSTINNTTNNYAAAAPIPNGGAIASSSAGTPGFAASNTGVGAPIAGVAPSTSGSILGAGGTNTTTVIPAIIGLGGGLFGGKNESTAQAAPANNGVAVASPGNGVAVAPPGNNVGDVSNQPNLTDETFAPPSSSGWTNVPANAVPPNITNGASSEWAAVPAAAIPAGILNNGSTTAGNSAIVASTPTRSSFGGNTFATAPSSAAFGGPSAGFTGPGAGSTSSGWTAVPAGAIPPGILNNSAPSTGAVVPVVAALPNSASAVAGSLPTSTGITSRTNMMNFALQNVSHSPSGDTLKVLLKNNGDRFFVLSPNQVVAMKNPCKAEQLVKARFNGKVVPPHGSVVGIIKLPPSEFGPATDIYMPNFYPCGIAQRDLYLSL